ncbi:MULTISPECIES: hypothetical protein [Enterobacter cloacae complex]|uniref:hypothetical protein n=1 Tax=Enterobacter cloacae complex TaxID=354276 RepID=UPI0028006A8F|nr:hypothetical protein [Enterobacter roggenkampii]MDV0448924.1 hypothetical protein [Enterobacter roggenkampii]MDV0462933.1 hypothetical protein [Enterobacter roggenkampii]MDV0467767.1 hypothetical protein [Enterobacter roggenkampii]MDV0532780.1 hypothetical protein [Enterobacter roggenkampii]MDV1255831.1 hypothetical protein [Enterobacter roggenkampii]
MTERGMIFNGEMVRAILDGRKTQTRRVMKPQPDPCPAPRGGHWWPSNVFKTMLHVEEEMQNGKGGWGGLVGDACPFGDVADRIWVRETWAEAGASAPDLKLYRANYPAHVPAHYENVPPAEDVRWTPSIHMPRWASRILLEITDVRVEQLNDISEEDARSEGISGSSARDVKEAYAALWRSIYGSDSWRANPWVWVIEFKRIEGDGHATD